MRAAAYLVVPVIALAGCSGGSPPRAAPAPSGPSTFAPTIPSPTSTPPRTFTAAQIVAGLRARGLPARLSVVFTQRTDTNHLLGRPNGYSSKAAFVDPRVRASDAPLKDKGEVDLGGGVEVFRDRSGALARAQYVQTFAKRIPAFNEYDYVSGPVLLRVSALLPPSVAKLYERALSATTGIETVGPVT